MKNLSARVGLLKPSSTVAVNARALELKRAGVDVISMAAGEPDFDTPDHVKQAAIEALQAGKTKYTAVEGIPELREAIAAKLERENKLTYQPSQISVTAGGKQALYNACFALIEPGDEVILPAPFWVTYPEQIRLFGGTPIYVDTRAEEAYVLDPDAVGAAITPRTKAIVLNSPNNPTGAVYPEEVIRVVSALAQKHDLWIISDEMYEHIAYGEGVPVSPARFAPERVITVNGASKTYAMTGWRIGYAAGPLEVMQAMNALQSQTTSNPNSIAQWATVAALKDSSAFIDMARQAFRERRDFIVAELNRIGLNTTLPMGAFYVLADTNPIHRDELEASRLMLERARVAVVPGTDFEAPGRVRLSYACGLSQIKEALERLEMLVK